MNETHSWERQFKKFIELGDLSSVRKSLQKVSRYQIISQTWTKYLPQIFAMLTSEQLKIPTFFRRSSVFFIFQLAVDQRMQQLSNSDLGIFRKNIEFLIRIIEGIFMETSSKRAIDNTMKASFHKYIQKVLLMLITNSYSQGKSALPQQKQKLLQKLYPTPNMKKNEAQVQFIYPDLLLWYQLALVIKNRMQFCQHAEERAVDYLANLRSQIQQIQSPILKWVYFYNTIQQALKVIEIFQLSESLQILCCRLISLSMIQIRDKFSHYLKPSYLHQSNLENNQNIFFAIIRFNVILLNFNLVSSILTQAKAKTFIIQAVSDIRKATLIVLSRCQQENYLIEGQFNPQLERIRKFEIQLRWIQYHLSAIQNKIVLAPKGENNFMDWSLFKKVYPFQNSNKDKDATRQRQFEELLHKQIALRREKKINSWRFSEGIKMFQLIKLSIFLLQTRFNLFIHAVKRILEPLEVLQLFIALLTEYHINHTQLILEAIQVAKQVTAFYLTHPQQIKLLADIENIFNAVSAIRISKIKDSKYVCSLCATISSIKICYHCHQNCSLFMYPKDMPAYIEGYWNQYISLYDFFINNELNRIPLSLRQQLSDKLFVAAFS